MSSIQRTLIQDDGQRVVLSYNHYLGLVFVAFAAIPMLVPFKTTSGQLGTTLTSVGAVALLLLGTALFLRRRSMAFDFRARRFELIKGFWPCTSHHVAPFEQIRSIEVFEKPHGSRRRTFEVRIWIERENDAFTFFETPDRSEAFDTQMHWQKRIAAPQPPMPTRRAA